MNKLYQERVDDIYDKLADILDEVREKFDDKQLEEIITMFNNLFQSY